MTNITNKTRSLLAGLALAAGLGTAHAGDVFWSIGMSQPGIHIGVGNLPAPVIVGAPVVVHPRPVYVPPPRVIYMPPRPVYYGYGYQGYGYGYGYGYGHERHHHHHGHRDRDYERHDHRGGDRGDRGHRR